MPITNDAIDIDLLTTWPKELLSLLDANAKQIVKYEQESLDFQESGKRYSMSDPASDYFNTIKNKISLILGNKQLQIYHATRITDPSIVQQEGLRPLNKKTQIEYVLKIVKDKYGIVVYDALREEISFQAKRLNLQYREGQVCFYITPRAGGIDNFLKYFGGEYIMRLLNNAPHLLEYLATIGSPKIVVISYPVALMDTGTVNIISECFIQTYKKLNNLRFNEHSGPDVIVKSHIKPSLILRVINPLTI